MVPGILSRCCLSLSLAATLAAPLAAAEPPVRSRGSEFQANVSVEGHQFESAVASQPGRSMVVWADQWRGLYGRVFDGSGQPVSPELTVDNGQPTYIEPRRIRIAADAYGGFLVVWLRIRLSPTVEMSVVAQRYDGNGDPLGSRLTIYDASAQEYLTTVDVVSRGTQGFLVAWTSAVASTHRILLQALDPLGKPQTGAFLVNQQQAGFKHDPRIAVQASGEALVTWIDQRETGNPDVWARRVSAAGQVRGPEFRVELNNGGETGGAVPVAHSDGGFSVVWSEQLLVPPFRPTLFAQRFDAAGHRVGQPVTLSEAVWNTNVFPAVAAGPDGNLLVLWSGIELDPDGGVMGRFFTPSWQPVGEFFRVNTERTFNQTEPALATDGHGGFTATWSSGEEPYIVTPQPPTFQGQDGSSYGVFGQRLEIADAPPCTRGSTVLCLGEGNRFEVRVRWTNPNNGESGTGKAVPLVADTGALWFFDESNLELLIKVLDARLVNGHFWVYYGALSDVEYTITVIDTVTRREKTYHNPPRRLASRADVEAFPDAASVQVAAAPAVSRSLLSPLPATAAGAAAVCQPSPASLCLNQSRFRVEVELVDPRDNTRKQGQAVPLTGDTGAFWFFGEDNLELLIKVLDGRLVNGRFWVYYGALSDVRYTITVTDTETREKRTYENAPGRLVSRADVEAFPLAGGG